MAQFDNKKSLLMNLLKNRRHNQYIFYLYKKNNVICQQRFSVQYFLRLVNVFIKFFCKLEKGDRVVFVSTANIYNIAAFFALSHLGIISVFIPHKSLAKEIIKIYKLTEAKISLCSKYYRYADELIESIGKDLFYVLEDICTLNDNGAFLFGDFNSTKLNEDDPCSIIFTSGTSAEPKGVILPHRSYINNAIQIGERIEIGENDNFLQVLPFCYTAGQITSVIMPLIHGADLTLTQFFDEDLFFYALEKCNVTMINLVPTMINRVLLSASSKTLKNNRLKICLVGGAACNTQKIKLFENVFNTRVLLGYGITEAGCGICLNSKDDKLEKSVGKPLKQHEIKVVDPQNDEIVLEPNSLGEILVKNNTSMLGYLKNKYIVFKDEWFKTGDLGYVNTDGYVFICGRKDDLIKRGGEKIFISEIEEVLRNNSNISQIAIVAVSDDDMENSLVAFVQRKDSRNITDDIERWLLNELPKYRRPILRTIDAMPLTISGKINYKKLKEIIEDEQK